MRRLMAALLLLAAHPSPAKEVNDTTTAIMRECLRDKEPHEIPQECIDRTAALCRNDKKYPSNVARLDCLSIVRDAWLAMVESEYAVAVRHAAERDADTLRLREAFKGQVVAPLILADLEQAQAAWKAFVAQDCKVVRLRYGAGSLAGHGQARCEIEHYGERALILRARRMGRMY